MTMANMDLFKVGKALRGRTVPTAISHQALLDKSKLFAKRSKARYAEPQRRA